jgi:hypothetical protein
MKYSQIEFGRSSTLLVTMLLNTLNAVSDTKDLFRQTVMNQPTHFLKFVLMMLFTVLAVSRLEAQQQLRITRSIDWKEPQKRAISQYDVQKIVYFENAQYLDYTQLIPWFGEVIQQTNAGAVSKANLEQPIYTALTTEESALISPAIILNEEPLLEVNTVYEKKKPFISIQLQPIRKKNGVLEKLVSFQLVINFASSPGSTNVNRATTTTSVLSTGNWHKIGVTSTGIHKISKSFLNSAGVNTNVDPRNFRLYGNGGAQLPERNDNYYPDDLVENAIYVSGESDGAFNDNDFILFYAQGPISWKYDITKGIFRHNKNIYADTAWYFITTGLGPGKRLEQQAQSTASPTATVTTFDDYAVIENDEENFIKSGRRWFGNRMEMVTSHSFSFNFPNIVAGTHKLISTLAARNSSPSSFSISVANQLFTQTVSSVSVSNYLDSYAKDSELISTFSASSPSIPVSVTKQNQSAIGWIDFLNLNVKRNLIFSGSQIAFRTIQQTAPGAVLDFQLSNASAGLKIWEVSNLYDIREQQYSLSGSALNFVVSGDTLRNFVAFNPGGNFSSPIFGGNVPNQNLHGTAQVDMIILTTPQLSGAAKTLARHHETFDGMNVLVVDNLNLIYNEFSSGKQDISAIRNFVKMFYDRALLAEEEPKYLLLFGDGSYDPRNRIAGNTNLIPTFESYESMAPIGSYASDDYFGLLDANEGGGAGLSGNLDIDIGRIPTASPEEATAFVNKIIHYATSQSCMNDWRNIICFVSDDDENGEDHTVQCELVSGVIQNDHPVYNIDKIYVDAFQQQAGAGGQRYPDANVAINNRVERGALMMNYAGHGGEASLALERIVTIPEINQWESYNNMPLFMTATCEFTRFDNPELVSAGEYMIMNPIGGAIALYSTIRLTFSTTNKQLNTSVCDTIFKLSNGQHLRVGDALRCGKNRVPSSFNNRSFGLFGDPALMLAFPPLNVITTEINNTATSTIPDTLSALGLVTIKGYVANESGSKATDFNGVIIPTVFDKPIAMRTLQNDGPSTPLRTFQLQKNIIFRGPATVSNGDFSFSFVVPQDIQFNTGLGKISYYARKNNSLTDAHGNYNNVIVGGFSTNPITDNKGPSIRLAMNNDQFVSGGMTNESPDFLAYVEDDIGINTVGTGIGHDITAVLDANSSNPIVLNDFYEAEQDNFRKGKVRYPFKNLSEGPHTITFKVWDVANNSSTASIDFVVVKSEELALSHVLNYPNPFTTNTEFFFEYNQPGISVDVTIQVFTISGKLVKTLESTMNNSGFRSDPISWNGLDDYGDRIGRGVYVYRLKVRTTDGKVAEKYEKLVIL